MIRITCSALEIARKNPTAYGQNLADGSYKKGGGSHGMFSCVQDVARLVHLGDLSVAEAIKELHRKFLRFNDTSYNKKKQEWLVERFVIYCRRYDENKFLLADGQRLMKWDFSADVRLSGRTPWVMANEKGFYSFILGENRFDWKSELRFPLFQKYLADNTINCELSDINVGIYSLTDAEFQFKNFTAAEILTAINEAGAILNSVFKEYKKRKV